MKGDLYNIEEISPTMTTIKGRKINKGVSAVTVGG